MVGLILNLCNLFYDVFSIFVVCIRNLKTSSLHSKLCYLLTKRNIYHMVNYMLKTFLIFFKYTKTVVNFLKISNESSRKDGKISSSSSDSFESCTSTNNIPSVERFDYLFANS